MKPFKSSSADKAGTPPDSSFNPDLTSNPFTPLADESSVQSDLKSSSSVNSARMSTMETQMKEVMSLKSQMTQMMSMFSAMMSKTNRITEDLTLCQMTTFMILTVFSISAISIVSRPTILASKTDRD